MTRFSYVCSHCGSSAIKWDAYAEWDDESQEFVLAATFDQAYCDDCGGETATDEIDLDDAPASFDHQRIARENSLQVRHDINGWYVCTDDEADHEDEGNNSAGFDGRDHFATPEEAWASAAGDRRLANA